MNKDEEAEVVALTLRAKVDELEVVDQESYNLANAINKQAYEGKKAFHTWFDPIDDASKKQRQATIAQGKKIDDPFDYVIKVTGTKAAAYMRAEQARVAEEKRRIEEAARKAAEEEQIKLAEKLAAEGKNAAADAAISAPVFIPKADIAEPEKAEGVSYRDVWSAEVIDLMALVKAVAEGKASLSYLAANDTALNAWARTTKGTEPIPGVKATNTPIQTRRM